LEPTPLMRKLAGIVEPILTNLWVFHQLNSLFFPIFNPQRFFLNCRGVLLKELLFIGLEDFPRWIGNDRIKSSTFVEYLVELVSPMKWVEARNILCGQIPFLRFALCPILFIPRRLFILDSQCSEFS